MSRSSGAKPGFDGNAHGHRVQLLVEARSTKFAAVREGGKSTKKNQFMSIKSLIFTAQLNRSAQLNKNA